MVPLSTRDHSITCAAAAAAVTALAKRDGPSEPWLVVVLGPDEVGEVVGKMLSGDGYLVVNSTDAAAVLELAVSRDAALVIIAEPARIPDVDGSFPELYRRRGGRAEIVVAATRADTRELGNDVVITPLDRASLLSVMRRPQRASRLA